MPIDIRLTAVNAASNQPLASCLATASGGEDIAVPVAGIEASGLGPYLGMPAADVISACGTADRAGDVGQVAAQVGDRIARILLFGLGDGSAAEMREAGATLARRVIPGRTVVTASRP